MIAYQNGNVKANLTAYVDNWPGGDGYLYIGGSSFGAGNVSLNMNDGSGSPFATFVAVASTTTNITTAGLIKFSAPAGATMQLVVAGSTNPSLAISVFIAP